MCCWEKRGRGIGQVATAEHVASKGAKQWPDCFTTTRKSVAYPSRPMLIKFQSPRSRHQWYRQCRKNLIAHYTLLAAQLDVVGSITGLGVDWHQIWNQKASYCRHSHWTGERKLYPTLARERCAAPLSPPLEESNIWNIVSILSLSSLSTTRAPLFSMGLHRIKPLMRFQLCLLDDGS